MKTRRGLTAGFGKQARGFTLLEVMVSLIITAIGLLGIAKIHALAYSSTATAGVRSLVALQTAGLAASMHANRTYWSTGAAPVTITITNTTIDDATLNGAAATVGYCVAGIGPAGCTPDLMAAYDLHTYAAQLFATLGNSNPITTINCAAVPPNPLSCTIKVTWSEKAVSVNKEGVANTAPLAFAPTYTLYVEP
jgi:type IV pilus assembly protein PilV